MKRKVAYATFFILLAISTSSCEMLFGNCMTCKKVMYNADGTIFVEYSEAVYCDEALAEILARKPHIDGSTTTKWECR